MQDGILDHAPVAFTAFPGQIGNQGHAVFLQAGGESADVFKMVVGVHQVIAEHVFRAAFHVIHDLAQEHGRGQHHAPHDVQVGCIFLQLRHDRVNFLVGPVGRLAADHGGQGIEPGNQLGQLRLAPGNFLFFKHTHPAGFAEVAVGQRAARAAETDLHTVFRIHHHADAECQGNIFPIQDLRCLLQDSGNRVRLHTVVDQQHPFFFPAGERSDRILVRETGQYALLRFGGRHIGHDHHLEMGIGKIDPQLGHGTGILGLSVHQAVEPGIPQRLLVFLQELRLLRPDFAHVLQRCFNAGKMLNRRSHQASAAFFIPGDIEMADQLPHRPGIMGHLHPQDRGHSGAQQYKADDRHQGEGAVVIPQPA